MVDRSAVQVSAGADDWEGVAESLGRQVGLDDPPVNAKHLAVLCGLRLRPWGKRGAALVGDVIYFDPGDPDYWQHASIFHETGHFALGWAGEEDSEDGAQYVGQALALPRRAYERDLRRTWNPAALRAKHVHTPAGWIVERIVHLRDAVATVIDEGRVTRRVASPWLPEERFRRISPWERELADRALELGEPVQGDELIWAAPVIEPPWRRVVIVAEARQLSLRL